MAYGRLFGGYGDPYGWDPEEGRYNPGAPGGGFGDFLSGIGGMIESVPTHPFGPPSQSQSGFHGPTPQEVRRARRKQRRRNKRRKAKGKKPLPLPSGGGGGIDPSDFSARPVASPFGGMDARVDAIVNSLLALEEQEQSNAMNDIRKQYRRLGKASAADALGYDKLARLLGRAGEAASDVAMQNLADEMNEVQRNVDPEGLSEVSSLENAANIADITGEKVGLGVGLDMSKGMDTSFMRGLRGIRQMQLGEDIAGLRRSRADQLAELRRERARTRAKRPLTRMEVQQKLEDMAAKRALTEQQLRSGEEDITNKQFGRGLSAAELAMKQEEFKFNKDQYKAASKAERENLINQILYGGTTKTKVPMRNPDGSLVMDDSGDVVYEEIIVGEGITPSSRGEAQQMLINAGVPKRRAAQAARVWAEEVRRRGIGAASTAASGWADLFGASRLGG